MVIFVFLFLISFFLGCQPRGEEKTPVALSLFKEGLKEKRLAGPIGRFGWLKRWFVQGIEHDKVNRQTLITTCFETTDYYLLIKYDFRSTNFEWKEYGAAKLDSLDKVDVEQPYRFWLRRFFFSATH